MKRAYVTADIVCQTLKIPAIKLKVLEELDYGMCDGLSYPEILNKYPDKIKVCLKSNLQERE